MAPGLAEMFSAAIKQLLKREGRGGQVVLAERLGIKKAHLSNLLAGRIQDSEVYDNILGVCEKICPTRKNSF